MHIPDGFLDTKTWVTLSIISGATVAIAVRRTKAVLDEKHIPLMGVMAAFVFAAQMVNFPVAGGTSGHFMGGVLASLFLGPFTGVLIMASLLLVQCLLFQDGGVTALGANIFNMGVIGAFGGYFVYRALFWLTAKAGNTRSARLASAGVAAWFSIVAASALCAVELALSGTVALKIALPAMAGVHALIGLGEAAVTVLVVGFVLKVRPDLLELDKN